ncbi:MAG TPA: arylesterase [Vicinamibacterales bacterium]|nr:arylesterase [Vicinamibacterales bacterium]
MPVSRIRRSSLLAILLAAAAAAACGNGGCLFGVEGPEGATETASRPEARAADPSDPPERPRIVALGDSLTAGYGLLESQSYPALLQARIDAEGYELQVVNAGVSGDTSAGGLRRLDWALDGDVRVLIVALGGNDALRGLSVADMGRNLSQIIRRARERNAVVILAGMEAPPNYGPEYAAAFRQVFADLARQERVLFIPFLLDKVAGRGELNQRDGIHPNEAGTRIVADTVWAVLRPVLDQMAASS